jgi:hypothetical protein
MEHDRREGTHSHPGYQRKRSLHRPMPNRRPFTQHWQLRFWRRALKRRWAGSAPTKTFTAEPPLQVIVATHHPRQQLRLHNKGVHREDSRTRRNKKPTNKIMLQPSQYLSWASVELFQMYVLSLFVSEKIIILNVRNIFKIFIRHLFCSMQNI